MKNYSQSIETLTIAQALRVKTNVNSQLLHETYVSIDSRELIQLLMHVLDKNYTFIRTYPDFQLTIEQTKHFLQFKEKYN